MLFYRTFSSLQGTPWTDQILQSLIFATCLHVDSFLKTSSENMKPLQGVTRGYVQQQSLLSFQLLFNETFHLNQTLLPRFCISCYNNLSFSAFFVT